MNEKELFARKLVQLRTKAKLSQDALAKKLLISRTTISKWETGLQEPSLGELASLSNFFNVSIGVLLGEDELPPKKIIVVDTSIFLNRPNVLEKLIKSFDLIVISSIVISELNYQKDKGKDNVKQRAWLAMASIDAMNKKDDQVVIDYNNYNGNYNDEKIVESAILYANESLNNKVYMFSNDILFKFLTTKYLNIKCITPVDFDREFSEETSYDLFLTQLFIDNVKNRNIKEIQKSDYSLIDVNKIDTVSGQTSLIIAIRNRDYELVKYLVGLENIDLNKRDSSKYSFTPLLHVCQLRDMRLMKILLEAGASVNSFGLGTNIGNTPLMVCAWGNFIDGLKYLMTFNVIYNQ